MKVTVEIADAILHEARNLAATRKTTLRQLVEESLRAAIDAQRPPRFQLQDGSFGGYGSRLSHWPEVRKAIYEGRGE